MLSALRSKLTRRLPVQALGALAGQVTLAVSSFVLQVAASRELGPAGFGTFALLFGAIIMATALSTGLLGDSLTVLDRTDPAIRAALFRLGVLVVSALALIGFGLSLTQLSVGTATLFALALAAFVLADLARRLLMANLRFWSLAFIDSVGFVAMAAFLVGCSLSGPLVLGQFLAALAIGQVVAGLLALTRLPAAERKLNLHGWGNWRAVIGYGSWRAVQQFVRPAMLNGARWVVLIIAGAAAVGELEAARVFVAPAMLLVQGFGSYLFSSYAAERAKGPRALLVRADRAALVMLTGSVLIAGLAGLLLPHLGWLLTAGKFELSLIATLGWACYAASCAAVLPYGSLAAVQGKQQWVLLIRLLDSLLGLSLVVVVLMGLSADTHWMPWLLSIGSFVGGLLCRQLLLRPAANQVEPVPVDVSA
jgi:O-antigen/teichoic acid export membrane protein